MTIESAYPPRPLALGKLKLVSLAIAVLVFAVTWIHPHWPVEQGLQSSLTVVAFLWLVWHARRWRMRDGEFLAVCFFIALHSVAARWLYSYVPYDAWCQRWLDWSPQLAFGWTRNNFDRLIHLAYGLCFLPAIHTWLRERWPLNKGQAFVIAVMAAMCSSLIYEWGEWAVALTLSPAQAEAYNGQQGDIWDAHMDMFLATIGSLLAWPLLGRTNAINRVDAA